MTLPKRISLSKIEGIGRAYEMKFREQGITTVESFLNLAATRRGREKLAERLGIPEKLLLEWTNLADLMRVKGIGEEYSQLLEAAGVDSPRELANRRHDHLYDKIVEINQQKKLVRRIPSLSLIKDWIEEAKQLKPVVTH
jgi:predicted flap endonuclease-1-like 5' DNA nuclease